MLFLSAWVVVFVSVSAAQQVGATISGSIQGPRPGEVPGEPKVVVIDVQTKREAYRADASADGRYRIANIVPGTYHVVACDRTAYMPHVRPNQELRDGENKEDFNFFLKDPPPGRSSIRGRLQDPSGAVLTSTEVILKNSGCELARTRTNAHGEYAFSDLAAPELYDVEPAAPSGFKRVLTTVALAMQQDFRVDITLSIGEVAETVTVQANPEAVATTGTNPEIIAGAVLRSIPLGALSSVDSLSLLAPGGGSRSSGSINGAAPLRNLFLLDGVENNDTLVSHTVVTPVPDQITEFQISQGALDTSRHSGFANLRTAAISRSGSNEFHGAAAYAGRNDGLDARDPFSLSEFRTFRRHNGVASLGGPLWKDHLFFFVSYDFARGIHAPTFSSIASSNLPALNQQLVQRGLAAEDLRRFQTTRATDTPLGRLDFKSNNHTVAARYFYQRDRGLRELYDQVAGTSSLPSTAKDHSGRAHLVAVSHNWTISPRLLNQASYHYRSDSNRVVPIESDELSLLFPGLALLGRSTSLLEGEGHRQRIQSLSEEFVIVYGKHTFHFGGKYSWAKQLFIFPAFQSGRAIVPNLAAFSAPVPRADIFEIGDGGSFTAFSTTSFEPYALYEVKLTSQLNLNLGLRYKAEFLGPFQADDSNGIQPRIGISWDLLGNSKLIFRFGYSIFRDQVPLFPISLKLLLGDPSLDSDIPATNRSVTSFIGDPAAGIGLDQFLNFGTSPLGPRLAVLYERDSQSPFAQTVTAGLSQELAKDVLFDLSYTLWRGTQLLTVTNVNLPPPSLVGGRPDFGNATLNPAFSQVFQFQTSGSSTSHAATLNTQVLRYQSYWIRATYTFSRSIDDVPSGSFEATPENVYDRKNDRGPSDFTVGHAFTVWANWDFWRLWNPNGNRILRIVGEPYVSGVLRAHSGRNLNVTVGSDANRDGNPLTDRPTGVGRNTFLGPSLVQVDVRLGSRIGLVESVRLEWSFDIFNLMNHTNFSAVNTVLGQADFSGLDPRIATGRREVSGFDYRSALAPNGFGLATRAFSPRRLQLGLRLTF